MSDPLNRVTGLALDAFTERHWDSHPLHRRSAELPGNGFDDLLSLAAVDELVSRRGLRTPFVRMSRDGDVLSPSRYTRGGGVGAEIADQVADDKLLSEFAAGATLVLQGMHRMWPPLQAFATAFTAQLGHPVQINAYVTPPQSRGFAAHYDVHDVFVLQFAGRKHWRVHEPVVRSPRRDEPWHERTAAVATRAGEPALIDDVLASGDTLYLPRGYVHSAASLGEISGHLTIGVHPVTRRSVADRVFAVLGQDDALRRSLPAGVDLANAAFLDSELDATVAALRDALDRLDREAVARGIVRHLATSTRPAPLRPIEQAAAAMRLAPEDRVRLRPGLYVAVRENGDRPFVEVEGGDVGLKPGTEAAARAATSGLPVRAGDLPGLDVAAAVGLLATLLRAGIVVPA